MIQHIRKDEQVDNTWGHIHLHGMGMVELALVSSPLAMESGFGLWPLFLLLSAHEALIPSLCLHLLCFLPHCGIYLYFSCLGLFGDYSISLRATPYPRGMLCPSSASLVLRGTTQVNTTQLI